MPKTVNHTKMQEFFQSPEGYLNRYEGYQNRCEGYQEVFHTTDTRKPKPAKS